MSEIDNGLKTRIEQTLIKIFFNTSHALYNCLAIENSTKTLIMFQVSNDNRQPQVTSYMFEHDILDFEKQLEDTEIALSESQKILKKFNQLLDEFANKNKQEKQVIIK